MAQQFKKAQPGAWSVSWRVQDDRGVDFMWNTLGAQAQSRILKESGAFYGVKMVRIVSSRGPGYTTAG